MSGDGERSQAAAVAWLARTADEHIETHAAHVFLSGERAYKMKRAVRYSFLDFSTLRRRRAALAHELELNRRTAPQLYRRLVPVAAAGCGFKLDGDGEPVEWLLEMARFDQAARLDRSAAAGGLPAELVTRLAEVVAGFHDKATPRRDCGGVAAMRAVTDGNIRDLRELEFEPTKVAELAARTDAALARAAPLLERRRELGLVRFCHGDLHLANIVQIEGEPVLFDCIEFDDALARIDTGYDLAFLLMDLVERGFAAAATRLLSVYLDVTRDDAMLALLPLFLSCRAAIRAKIAGFAGDPGGGAYLDLALRALTPPPARLVAVGGLSGSGKSTLAFALAPGIGPLPGAVVVRTDALRKRLAGATPDARLPTTAYTAEASARVYARLCAVADAVLAAGHGVIVDGVFARAEERAAVEAVAARRGVTFAGFWLHAPVTTLKRRVAARTGDVSDADAAVVDRQTRYDIGTVAWHEVDAAGEPQRIVERVRAIIDQS